MRTLFRLIAPLLSFAALALPSPAAAQWRYPPLYPPYGAYRYSQPESNIRLNVKPKDASVYVDGYFAGKVEEFDGKFQRLHVLPGEHEITLYLDGYRPLKQRLYLGPNATRTLDGLLEKLAPGAAQEPKPEPSERDRDRMALRDEGEPMPPLRGPMARRGPPTPPPAQRAPREGPAESSRFAALSIRVQPGGATVRVDGERWDGPSNDERLIIQVSEGHHVVQIERDGYELLSTEIDVRRGETAPLSIVLRRNR